MVVVGRDILGENSRAKEIEQVAEWIETTLTETLNSHASTLRLTAGFKRW